jgi:hypothetical protein
MGLLPVIRLFQGGLSETNDGVNLPLHEPGLLAYHSGCGWLSESNRLARNRCDINRGSGIALHNFIVWRRIIVAI